MLSCRRHLGFHSGTQSATAFTSVRSYLVSNALCHTRDLVHARLGLRDAIFRPRCRFGTRFYPLRKVLSILRNLPGMARSGAHRQRHVVKRALRQPAAHYLAAARPRSGADVRRQQRRRRNGEDGGCAVDLRGNSSDQSAWKRGPDLPLRGVALDRTGSDRGIDRFDVRLCVSPCSATRTDPGTLEWSRVVLVKNCHPEARCWPKDLPE